MHHLHPNPLLRLPAHDLKLCSERSAGSGISIPYSMLGAEMRVCVCMQAGARMHDELYGHLLAALRFGAGEDGCRSAVCITFEPAQPDGALHLRITNFATYSTLATHVHGSKCVLLCGSSP